ncbi:MAG: hydroxyethylthiazole kinase [Firmicutes bacterium]|nr:hydroxyethylthiazole kinase [Bacillota bacterium]
MDCTKIVNKLIYEREKIREKKPLIHHITNYITANDSANITLSIGASPVMVDNPAEIKEIIQMADALVLNIGSLSPGQEEVCLKAVELANKRDVPVILDPVGAGAISIRKELVISLLSDYKINIIKGNLAEIKSIIDIPTSVKGVDSEDTMGGAGEAARELAWKYNTITVITGKQDFISDGKSIIIINNGVPILAMLTGTGCMTASLIGAFSAVEGGSLYAAAGGVLTMGIAGQLAARQSAGPGMLRYKLIDEVYHINENKYKKLAQISFKS